MVERIPMDAGAPPPVSDAAVDAGDGGWDDTAVLVGLHPSVQQKIAALRERMTQLGRRVYLMSGARPGPPSSGMHNQALAVDVTVDYMNSVDVAEALRAVGFPCVITYYDRHRTPCHMAHGDLRGTNLAVGPYAPGAHRALNCPGMAVSRTETCENETRAQWDYLRERSSR